MSDDNYFEIIKNKLDALVDKIIQKDSSEENFRMTYAQILEKINTKMDVFSSTGEIEKIELLGTEVRTLICEKDETVHKKLSALLKDFEELDQKMQNCIKTPEIIQAFQTVQKNIKYFSEEIENQRSAFNSIVSYIEKFGTLENTNRYLESEFSIVKGQNAIINDTLTNQIKTLNAHSKEYDQKFIELISTINEDLNDLLEQNKGFAQKGDTNLIFNKIEELTLQLENSKGYIVNISNNMMTLIDVVDNIFQNEDFDKIQANIGNIIVNTTLLSDAISKLGKRDEIEEIINDANCDNKKYNEELISTLEEKLLEKLDFSAIESIKDYTEKMFYQGTEVLKEEIWTIKDTVIEVKENLSTITESIDTKLDGLRSEITDTLTKESIAKAYQFENITETVLEKQSAKIDAAKEEITDVISEESIAASNQIASLNTLIENIKNESLTNMQKQFVTQLIQVAENISFVEEAEEIHEHIYDISDEIKEKITTDINALKNHSELNSKDMVKLLEKINERITGGNNDNDYLYTLPDVESDLSKIRLDLSNITKSLESSDNLSDENLNEIYNSITKLKSSIENLENAPIAEDISEVKSLFDELNEDISSISKRTNKLILTSDEVNKTLQRHIDEFTGVVQYFDSVTRKFTEDSLILSLNRKIDNLTGLSNSLVSSDKILNEAFMYLAEWIDTTSDSFGEIKENIGEINNKINKMSSDTEQAFAISNMQNINEKIDEQEVKLVVISEKLDSLLNQKSDDSEVKSLLEFIASQIGVANEKMIEHDKMAQRVENMEKQLKKIEKNVGLITSYIEDED